MPLKNHQDAIPGGFQFYQPETNWDSKVHCPWPIWPQLRDAIIRMREINPRFNLSINPGVVEAEMDYFNSRRLESMPGTAHFLTPGTPVTGVPPNFTQPRRLARSVAAVSRMSVGIGVVAEMFGPNMEPVAPELAEKRAAICAGTSDATKCSKNIRGNLLQRFTQEVVKGIQSTLEIVKEMELKTSVDDRLGICSACTCPLKLKSHVNLDFILANTTPETMAKFVPNCWIVLRDKI